MLKPDAPERYIVVPGDTLWSISERYTDSPWRWPELWGMNREQIRNPHLIYPGDVITLDRIRGRLSLAGGQAGSRGLAPGTAKLSPRVRAEAIAREGIPSIPASIIEPFLTRPLVVEPDGLKNAPTIVATDGDRVILSAGARAYVRGIPDAKEEAAWWVYRQGGPLVDPDSKQTLAYEAVYLGTAHVARSGDPATVELTETVQEVGPGDKLVAAARALPANYAPHAPAADIRGRVMTIYGGVGQVGEAGRHSIVTLNRGIANGLEIGHVLALHTAGRSVRDVTKEAGASDARIALPEERYGIVFVFRVFDRVSYALVMDASRPVSPGDVVRTP
ncbi:MAG TPA: LysM peptidoglycan-binding domain-containing protein [Burkholderiales bacterium]|nr:LysM peptidoglycan-binding domain-containing protein [Burkholderiales bacterium]